MAKAAYLHLKTGAESDFVCTRLGKLHQEYVDQKTLPETHIIYRMISI